MKDKRTMNDAIAIAKKEASWYAKVFLGASLATATLYGLEYLATRSMERDTETNVHTDFKMYTQGDSTICLRDINRDGSFDTKSVIYRDTMGSVIRNNVYVKKSFLKQYYAPSRRSFTTVVPDSTKLE